MLLLRKLSYCIIMTNFNGINPWLNTLNYLNAVKQNQSNGNIPNTQNIQNQPTLTEQFTQSQNILTKTPADYVNKMEQSAMQDILKMNNESVQKYLQSLLNMPESIDKFLKAANIKNGDSEGYQFLKIFLQNMLSNKELSQILNQNSNNAIQKLLNTITQSLRSGSDATQLKEILSVLNVIHTSATVNSNTLRELFLLYIPISYQVYKEDSNFDKITEDNEEGIKESALSILFETYNFSNILVLLSEDKGIITSEIRVGENFPYDKFKNMVTSLAKENSIIIASDFLKIKDMGIKGQKQNFKIISNDFVPITILNASNIIIKTIFKLDKDLKEISG